MGEKLCPTSLKKLTVLADERTSLDRPRRAGSGGVFAYLGLRAATNGPYSTSAAGAYAYWVALASEALSPSDTFTAGSTTPIRCRLLLLVRNGGIV